MLLTKTARSRLPSEADGEDRGSKGMGYKVVISGVGYLYKLPRRLPATDKWKYFTPTWVSCHERRPA